MLQFIKESPGVHFGGIRRQLGLSNGTLVHHLSMLERLGEVRSRRDGQYRRYYPFAARLPEVDGSESTLLHHALLQTIARCGGVTPTQLAALHKASKQAVNYHLQLLRRKGLVRSSRQGRHTRYLPVQRA